MTSHAAMTAAIEALENSAPTNVGVGWIKKHNAALAALRAAAQQPQSNSVDPAPSLRLEASVGPDHAPGWIALTDEDRKRAFESLPNMLDGFLKQWGWLHFAKAIEAKCREKNAPTCVAGAARSNEKAPASAPLSVEAQPDIAALLKEARTFVDEIALDLLHQQLATYKGIYSEKFQPQRLAGAQAELDTATRLIARIDAVLPRSEEG